MAIIDQYRRYLDHFGGTIPVRELHADSETTGLCALRHDVDYDLDVALEMAYWEHKAGARATYYLLPTAPYWADERLPDKCLQLQDYGHEVGLHVNALAQWAGGETDDPEHTLIEQLDVLRKSGISVTGIAAHGDGRCYEFGVSNYWCFRELKPNDPAQHEDGRTAEGPYESAPENRRLHYPTDHVAIRRDGSRYLLWSISMEKLRLNYHAWHTNFDRYFSDSGGAWNRTPNPIEYVKNSERWQVLIHPIYWRAKPKLYFFLSSARSGSRWLSDVLATATPFEARHEYILNQDFHRGVTSAKATSQIVELEENRDEVERRLLEAWDELSENRSDYAEVNIYLEPFTDLLRKIFPEAVLIHLRRDESWVVRSLMDRNWYDTPEDPQHPRLHDAPTDCTQFERVCHYVAQANRRIARVADYEIRLEDVTTDAVALERALGEIGVPFHSRLGSPCVERVMNATKNPGYPVPSDWTSQNTALLQDIVTGGSGASVRHPPGSAVVMAVRKLARVLCTRYLTRKQLIASGPNPATHFYKRGIANCEVAFTRQPKMLRIHTYGNGRHATLCLGGSNWYEACTGICHLSGWKVDARCYFRGCIESDIPKGGKITLFGISYDTGGRAIHRRSLGILDHARKTITFACTARPNARLFDIALYMPADQGVKSLALTNWYIERIPVGGDQ